MTYSKRVQVLMEPDEYAALERLAQQQQGSVADLIRQAVQERWLGGASDRPAAAQALCGMGLKSFDENLSEAEATTARSITASLPQSPALPGGSP